jgi:hypothetical protein
VKYGKAVSLVTNRPGKWTYLPPHVFGSSGYLIRRVGIRVAGQPGIWSYSHATDIRPAHIGCAYGPAVTCGGPVPRPGMSGKRLLQNYRWIFQACELGLPLQG